jgi:hypothetical protein
VRRLITAVIATVFVGAAAISAQFVVFDEVFEGEIWELISTLQIPPAVDADGEPRPGANWASGIAWVNGELFVADNYMSVITKFDESLQPVRLPAADWYGAAGSPTAGWTPNEAIPADVIVNGGAARQALIVTDSSRSRFFAFWPDGEHVFTVMVSEQPGSAAYTASLNGIALAPGGRFELDQLPGKQPTLRVSGKLAVAWPEYFDLASGGALIFADREFVYDGANSHFVAAAPDVVLTGGEDETGDASVPAVKAVTGVTFDSAGNFYMVDSWTGRLHGYDSNFEHQFVFGTPDATGETTEEFEEAYGMTLWPSAAGDRLLVTLPWKNRAVVYAPNPRSGAPATIEYLFKLDGLGAVDGLPHSSAFDPKNGRVAVSDSGDNSVKVFQTPALAVFDLRVIDAADQPAVSVCGGEHYTVNFSLTVPEGRSPLQMVTPRLLINGVETSVVPAPADSSYGTSGVGPLSPRDVISYSYSLTAPNIDLPQALAFTATASASTTSLDAAGNHAEVTDIFEKFGEFAVIDCGSTNAAPLITAVTPVSPQSNGWTRIEPSPAPLSFTVMLEASDTDGEISRITYSASGTNSIPSTTVFSQTQVPISLLQPGITTINYRAFDDQLKPSAPGSLTVRLDNSLPSICLNIPPADVIKPAGDRWWKGTVTIPVLLTDNQDPSPRIVAPIPVNYINGTLVFANEGAGQFATLIAEDHAGHQRVQASNTSLDVCGPGKVGQPINIDKSAPTVSEDADEAAVHRSSFTVTITAADALSAVRYVEYSVNDGPFSQVEAAAVPVLIGETTTLRFRAVDWAGNASALETRRYIVDTTANLSPICSAASTTTDMWPPNHKHVYVTIAGVTDPDGQPVTIRFTSILQDEPTNSVGQGNTLQDGGIEQNGARAWVRAERSGTAKVPGDGRVYLIGFSATDPLGGSCAGTVRVGVPHDQRGRGAVLSPGRWNSVTGLPVIP